jgi:hypothetical protein
MDNLVKQKSTKKKRIQDVLKHIAKHPLETMISDWHWKAALFSALFRTPVFLIAYHKQGLSIALTAGLIQFCFRTIFGGIGGSIIQKFSKVEPPWHATMTVPICLTIVSHLIEYTIQIIFDDYYGTNMAEKAIIASVTISVMSAVFNLFVMRQGVLLVKDDNQQSIWKDFSYIPRLVFDFVMIPSRNIYKRLSQRQYLTAVLVALMQSLVTGIIAAILRGPSNPIQHLKWGYWTGAIVFALTVIAVSVLAFSASRKYSGIEALGD